MVQQIVDFAMSLDVFTLFVTAVAVTALLGLVLLSVWAQDRIRALAWWGAAYLLGGAAILLWSMDSLAYSPLAGLPGALLLLACGMIWTAARLFHGRPIVWPAMLAGATVWLLVCVLVEPAHSFAQRIVLSSVIISTYTFLTALELWRERRKSLIRRWPAIFVPILHGAVFLFPVPLAGLFPEERGVFSLAGGWIAIFALEALLYIVGTAFIVLVLTKERAVRLHKTAAITDPLTGLFNRRGFFEGAQKMIRMQARKGKPIAVLVFDLDHFKAINDRFGHAIGDDTLKLFATTISKSLRATDLVARFGGEEFAVLIPEKLDDAMLVAERLRKTFANAARMVSDRFVGATVSIGVAGGEATTGIDILVERADAALYCAKHRGRNRVEKAPPLMPGELGDATGIEGAIVDWTVPPKAAAARGHAA
jgi:diguanylate cyclase (GGDEF)-like protein